MLAFGNPVRRPDSEKQSMSTIDPAVIERFVCHRMVPTKRITDLKEDAREGLIRPPRFLAPKYFYDDRGSELFDRICDTEEYYVTRTESALLERIAAQVIEHISPARILELGAGTARKTGHLLRACRNAGINPVYSPCDVCEAVLHHSADAMTRLFEDLRVEAYAGDYLAGLPAVGGLSPVLYVFLGSSLGNYSNVEAIGLLSEVRSHMNSGDLLLLGLDRIKSTETLTAAYNDAEGVTAQFNLNLLRVLNRELGANFNEDAFCHEAVYNGEKAQIEMYLKALSAQRVELASLECTIELAAGERILTEISRKYSMESARSIYADAGFSLAAQFHAPDQAFTLLLLAPDTSVAV